MRQLTNKSKCLEGLPTAFRMGSIFGDLCNTVVFIRDLGRRTAALLDNESVQGSKYQKFAREARHAGDATKMALNFGARNIKQ